MRPYEGPRLPAGHERPVDVTAGSAARTSGDSLLRLRSELHDLYGATGRRAVEDLIAQVRRHAAWPPRAEGSRAWTERDSMLITYGDQVRAPGEAPLRTLDRFLRKRLAGLVSAVHLLPLYPWSSDDGFAVTDLSSIDPALGDWDDVARIAGDFRVMLDVVLNHVSASHPWVAGFLAGDPAYDDHFIEVPPGIDLSSVVRPRARPLVTPFPTTRGERFLWTTFSADQVDLNYRNPRVLARMVDVVLGYLEHGATLLRLDAVGFSWKEPGTSCLNLEGAHRLVRVFRAIVAAVAPSVSLVTETNVPQDENVAYFGDGTHEAQAVYQFSLPPLVLHAVLSGTSDRLASWISELEPPPPGCTFLNMLATHDGIGLMPAEGLLSEADIRDTVDEAVRHGGLLSMRDTPFGPRPYELNTTLFDALSDPSADEPESLQVARFLAANAVMLELSGVPAVYVHSLLGSPNDRVAAEVSGVPRHINRSRFDERELDAALAERGSRTRRVFDGYSALLRGRASHAAFRPDSPQAVLDAPAGVLSIERGSAGTGRVRCLTNLTSGRVVARARGAGRDLMSGREATAGQSVSLGPYEVLWLAEH